MRRAFALFGVLILILIFSFCMVFYLRISAYSPRILLETKEYLETRALLDENIVRGFLAHARESGFECLSEIEFEFEGKKAKIEYFYPLATCKNEKFSELNQDADFNEDGVILARFSVQKNFGENVNDEIFVQKNFILKADKIFWTKF